MLFTANSCWLQIYNINQLVQQSSYMTCFLPTVIFWERVVDKSVVLVTPKYFFLGFAKFKMCYNKQHCSTYCYDIIQQRTKRSTSGGSLGLASCPPSFEPRAQRWYLSSGIFPIFVSYMSWRFTWRVQVMDVVYEALCSFVDFQKDVCCVYVVRASVCGVQSSDIAKVTVHCIIICYILSSICFKL